MKPTGVTATLSYATSLLRAARAPVIDLGADETLAIRSSDGDIAFTVRIVEDGIRVEAVDPKAPAWNDDETGTTGPVMPNIEFTYP